MGDGLRITAKYNSTRSFFLNSAQQRIFSRLCQVHCLFALHLGDLIGIYAGDADAFVMDLEHDGESLGVGPRKDILQNKNDKLHRREIIVVQYDLKELWLFELGLFLDQDRAAAFDVRQLRHSMIIRNSPQRHRDTESIKKVS